ncbi:MAG: hypothetical protein DMF53_13155 [Acidobacteria bacterium]|nr:MAG: hypothetical protein DMF53_13155 [Acidobacteriota bacterium]
MQAHKQTVTVPEDHQLEIRLPADFPAGPAEVIVLAGPSETQELDETRQEMLRVVQKLRTFKPTPEEDRVVDEFEEFQRQHPINFSSLSEEE